MTTVAVLAEPPESASVFPSLVGDVLDPDEARRLYRAMLVDVCRAVQDSGASLLVNHPPEDRVDGDDPAAALGDALGDLVPNPDDVRYEVQVGETFAGRVGNTLTHLLEGEGVATAAATTPAAAFMGRSEFGSAAMKLRSSEVVLGPAAGGRVYFAGFAEPVDFTDAYDPPAVETLTDRGLEADLSVDYLPRAPLLETAADLADAVAMLGARRRSDRNVPAGTAAVVEELGLVARPTDDGLTVARSDNA